MTTKLLGILVATTILLLTNSICLAKTINFTGQEIIVKVTPQKMTEISLKGTKIASVILGFNADSISIQNAGESLLYVQPLTTLNGHFFVTTDDGRSIMFTLISVPEEMMDKKIEVIFAEQSETQRISKLNERGLTPAGLIKIMITKNIPEEIIYTKKSVNLGGIIATEVYDAGFMQGFSGKVPYSDFDITKINMQGILAGAVRDGNFYIVIYKPEVR